MSERENENKAQVEGIFNDVVAAAKGEYHYTDENGEERDDGTLNDYLTDMLDITYEVRKVDGKTEVIGCKIMVAYGGPNIYITDERVELYWWSDTAFSDYFDSDTKNALIDFASEMFGNY